MFVKSRCFIGGNKWHGAEKSRSAMVTATASPIAKYSAQDALINYPTNPESKMFRTQGATSLADSESKRLATLSCITKPLS